MSQASLTQWTRGWLALALLGSIPYGLWLGGALPAGSGIVPVFDGKQLSARLVIAASAQFEAARNGGDVGRRVPGPVLQAGGLSQPYRREDRNQSIALDRENFTCADGVMSLAKLALQGEPLPAWVASEVRQVGPHRYAVGRRVLALAAARSWGHPLNPPLRSVPELADQRIAGLRIFGVGRDSVFALIGIEDGDRLDRIGKYRTGTPEGFLGAFGYLRCARRVEFQLTRKGRPMILEVTID